MAGIKTNSFRNVWIETKKKKLQGSKPKFVNFIRIKNIFKPFIEYIFESFPLLD